MTGDETTAVKVKAPAGEGDHRLTARHPVGGGSAAPATFEQIVEQYQARLAHLANRLLGWPSDVDDVLQEVFLAAWRHHGKFKEQSSLETWLMRITINKCRNWLRRLRLRWAKSAAIEPVKADLNGPDKPAMAGETSQQVRQAVSKLPGRYREVVVLFYLEQMPAAQIMDILKINRGTLDVRLNRARKLLREKLKDSNND